MLSTDHPSLKNDEEGVCPPCHAVSINTKWHDVGDDDEKASVQANVNERAGVQVSSHFLSFSSYILTNPPFQIDFKPHEDEKNHSTERAARYAHTF